MNIVLIDGMPGCGKSTLTDNLARIFKDQGKESNSYTELLREHPVFPRRGKDADVHHQGYLKIDLDNWRKFVSVNVQREDIHFFDAAPFQNAIRFALESNNGQLIEEYYSELEEVLSEAAPMLIYLRPECPLKQTDYCIQDKGDAWSKNVSDYLESSRYSQQRAWKGIEGMRNFWADYVSLCESLVAKTTMPSKVITSVPGEWNRMQDEALSFVSEVMA